MIDTITLNPSLDYYMRVPSLSLGQVARSESETLYPGGKGINVSIVLSRLGIPSRALGFVAGFTGKEISRLTREAGCETDFIPLAKGTSRINVKLRHGPASREETDVNGQGPELPENALDLLAARLVHLDKEDMLALAGSVPSSVAGGARFYEKLLVRLEGRGILAAVDASGELLTRSLPHRPFLIKPNLEELSELFGGSLRGREEIAACARRLREWGARNVLVSLGGEGAALFSEDGEERFLEAHAGTAVNTVGAGDSMVAGFLAGWACTHSYEKALRLSVAAGSASAFSAWLPEREDILRLLGGPIDS